MAAFSMLDVVELDKKDASESDADKRKRKREHTVLEAALSDDRKRRKANNPIILPSQLAGANTPPAPALNVKPAEKLKRGRRGKNLTDKEKKGRTETRRKGACERTRRCRVKRIETNRLCLEELQHIKEIMVRTATAIENHALILKEMRAMLSQMHYRSLP